MNVLKILLGLVLLALIFPGLFLLTIILLPIRLILFLLFFIAGIKLLADGISEPNRP